MNLSTSNSHIIIIFMCTFLVCHLCSAKDNITTGESIIESSLVYLESEGMKFQMGFFRCGNTSDGRRYVGIWYRENRTTVVWVANRDKPVLDSTGFLTVTTDGNFKVLNKDPNAHYFSTDIEGAPKTALKLYDNGNVVLINVATKNILWQSFDHPTDTFLPGMKMDKDMKLTSWKSASDPGSGSFVFQLEADTTNRYSILKGSTTYHWKSGKMSINSFDDNQISSNAFKLLSNATISISRKGKVVSSTISTVDANSRLVMGHVGRVQYYSQWDLKWEEPKDNCSVYNVCGQFGMCSVNNEPMCSCLSGFEHNSPDGYTHRCKRTTEICDISTNSTFINQTMISMDDTNLSNQEASDESECRKKCLEECSCLAYSYTYPNTSRLWDRSRENTQACWLWSTEPYNLRGEGTHNISFRLYIPSKGMFFDASTCRTDCMLDQCTFRIVEYHACSSSLKKSKG